MYAPTPVVLNELALTFVHRHRNVLLNCIVQHDDGGEEVGLIIADLLVDFMVDFEDELNSMSRYETLALSRFASGQRTL
jgi:hypothetical protein